MISFLCRFGTFGFAAMYFMLINALATSQRIMNERLKGFPYAMVHLYDISIFSKDFTNHFAEVGKTLKQIFEAEASVET